MQRIFFHIGGSMLDGQASVTKYRGVGGWNNRSRCSHRWRGCKSKVKVWAVLASPETSLSWLAVITRPFVCAFPYIPGASSQEDTSPVVIGLHLYDFFFWLMTSFNLHYLLKGPFAKYSHVLSIGSQVFSIGIWGGDTVQAAKEKEKQLLESQTKKLK